MMKITLFLFAVTAVLVSSQTFQIRHALETVRSSNSSHTTTTVQIPNYSNATARSIDCSRQSSYCSGADNRSRINISQIVARNLSITVNKNGTGLLHGTLLFPYTAHLINSTSTVQVEETIESKFHGRANLSIFGYVKKVNGTYIVKVATFAPVDVTFDRNYFIANAGNELFYSIYSRELQRYINNYFQGNASTKEIAFPSTIKTYIPAYVNSTQFTINCKNQSGFCAGDSELNFIKVKNVSSRHLSTINGRLNGSLVIEYYAEKLISKTETVISTRRLSGSATMNITGDVLVAKWTGKESASVAPHTTAVVTLDVDSFVKNGIEKIYSNLYALYIQNHFTAALQV